MRFFDKKKLIGNAVTVWPAPPQGFLEDQLERGWWAGSEAGLLPQTRAPDKALLLKVDHPHTTVAVGLAPHKTPAAEHISPHNPVVGGLLPHKTLTAESPSPHKKSPASTAENVSPHRLYC